MSLYTSLSGLRGAQTALSTIANNVANAATNGFKRSQVGFGDLSPPSSTTPGYGVRVTAINQQFTRGGIDASSSNLDVALSGTGFLVTRAEGVDGQTYLTRNGALGFNSGRFLTDSGGNLVQVLPANVDGSVSAGGLESARALQLPTRSGVPVATTSLNFTAALPLTADKPALRPAYTNGQPYAFNPADPLSYNFRQQTSLVDAAGQQVNASLYFAATSSVAAGDATDTWNVHVVIGGVDATPTPINLSFDANGVLTSPTGPTPLTTVTPPGVAAPLSISLGLGNTNLGGVEFAVTNITQNGVTSSAFSDFQISPDGVLTASFADGRSEVLGRLLLANVPDPSGLRQAGDAQWTLARDAGPPSFGSPGDGAFGNLQIGAIERSNVDLTEELVALIAAQRTFQANARAVDAANTLSQTVIGLQN